MYLLGLSRPQHCTFMPCSQMLNRKPTGRVTISRESFEHIHMCLVAEAMQCVYRNLVRPPAACCYSAVYHLLPAGSPLSAGTVGLNVTTVGSKRCRRNKAKLSACRVISGYPAQR